MKIPDHVVCSAPTSYWGISNDINFDIWNVVPKDVLSIFIGIKIVLTSCKSQYIHIFHRVIEAVAVAVVVLGVVGSLNERVGAEEAAHGGVVEPGVHVHQAEPRQVLVAGVAAPQQQIGLSIGAVWLQCLRVAQKSLAYRILFFQNHISLTLTPMVMLR